MDVPELRFPEFSGEWEKKKLGEITILNPKSNNFPDKFVYIDLESVESGILKKKKIINKKEAPSRAQRVLKNNDILYQTVRPYQKNNLFFQENDPEKFVASTGYAQIRAKQDSMFVYQVLHTEKFVNKVLSRCTGTSYPAINSKDLGKINIKIPSLSEQEKIASFLSKIDEKIEKLEKKQLFWKTYKKGIMQQIFSQKLRFKDENGEDYSDWKNSNLGNVLIEVNEKTTVNNQFDVISSTKECIVLQKEYFDRIIASKNNKGYKILRKNQLVLSPQNLWLGNININDKYEVGIVSPSYKIYQINENILINYLKFIIKTPRMLYEYKMASEQGASIVRRNLDKELFNDIPLLIPSIPEQIKISNLLSLTEIKLDEINKEVDYNKEFKKGLLQQMFC